MNLRIEEHVRLSDHTTLKTGGVVRYMVQVGTREDVEAAVLFVREQGLPYFILGGGSNVLAPDEGFPGILIKVALTGCEYVTQADGSILLTAAAGEELDAVVADTVARGYWGLENLSAIPGTVGATPVQNVGAYGVEVKDCIEAVETYHVPTKSWKTFTNAECQFGYRDSFFKTEAGKEYVIVSVRFRLSSTPVPRVSYRDLAQYFASTPLPTLTAVREAVAFIRSRKFPDWHTVGTAGSFFKNPIVEREIADALTALYPELPVFEVNEREKKVSLGYVLDKICGLKGYRHGAVGLYEAQALVLVNYGGATTAEIRGFVREVATIVKEKTRLEIEPEVRTIE